MLQKSGRMTPEFAVAGKSVSFQPRTDFSTTELNEKANFSAEQTLPDTGNFSLFFRRLFDLAFSATVLVVLSPLFALIALMIKIQSPGAPVIFTQKRLGLNGELFNLYKFRTMVPNAEEILADWLETRPEVKEEYFTYRKLKNDPRIIPYIGTFLRKSSLDELPQFLNVLLGDMAVVGPRPYIKEEFYKHPQEIVDAITSVKPGITGYWQTRERHENTFASRVETDLEYLSIRSVALDLQLIFQTVSSMLLKKGA
ncbi:MAG: sugar transferase [Candidatus Riflebacteria bacterium]